MGVVPIANKDKVKVIRRISGVDVSFTSPQAAYLEAKAVHAAQYPRSSTPLNVAGLSHANTLPGGVPLVDHLQAWVTNNVSWRSLTPTARWLQDNRLPEEDNLLNFKEVTIGLSTPTEVTDEKSITTTVFLVSAGSE